MDTINWYNLEAGNIIKYLLLLPHNFLPFLYVIVISFLGLILLYIAIRYVFVLKNLLIEKSILLELTPPAFSEKSAYTTEQLFTVIHGLGKNQRLFEKILGIQPRLSFEIVSTHKKGIRYLVRTNPEYATILKRTMLSYLPQVQINETDEYIDDKSKYKIVEFKLGRHFAYPLQKQQLLDQHDPVAYITGMMTQLTTEELLSFQIVISPTQTKETKQIKHMIHRNENVLDYLDRVQIPNGIQPVSLVLQVIFKVLKGIVHEAQWVLNELLHPATYPVNMQQNNLYQQLQIQQHIKPARTLTRFEQETIEAIQEKIDQPLFESSIRLLLCVKENHDERERISGFISS